MKLKILYGALSFALAGGVCAFAAGNVDIFSKPANNNLYLQTATETPTSSRCLEPKETRTFSQGGVTKQITLDCWKWEDTYRAQEANNGTCEALQKDKSCTRVSVKCEDEHEGICYSQRDVYQCQTTTAGKGQVCGDELFCNDGSCVESNTGFNNDFGKAVSALAALNEAGEDAKGKTDVSIFKGKPQACRKAFAGFKNCCKSGGWGVDVGLASCSDGEKALGKAKDKGITIHVGTYCSLKTPVGICLQKKTSYCVFDSKIGKIVQEQGRKGQLGISFGSGENPDCRGLTVAEFSKLRFDKVNWEEFYDDIKQNADLPEDKELVERMKDSFKGFGTGANNTNGNPKKPFN